MGIDFTSTAMIDSIKTRALLPSSQNLYTNRVLVKIITEELHADIVPLIMSCREEYFVNYYDQAIVSGQTQYEIPSRAIGQKLRDVVLVNSDGREVSLPRIETDQLKHQFNYGNYSSQTNRRGFFFQDGYVVLFPDTFSASGHSLRMKYFRRPNNVVLTSEAGQVTAINTGTGDVTLTNVPNTWLPADTFDVIKGIPGFKSLADDVTLTAISSPTKIIRFSTIPTGLVIGDWVALSGFSPITQIPYEVFNILEQRVVIKILEEMKDSEGLKNAADVYKDMVEKVKTLLSPRADGSPKRIVRNSILFGEGRTYGNWW